MNSPVLTDGLAPQTCLLRRHVKERRFQNPSSHLMHHHGCSGLVVKCDADWGDECLSSMLHFTGVGQ